MVFLFYLVGYLMAMIALIRMIENGVYSFRTMFLWFGGIFLIVFTLT